MGINGKKYEDLTLAELQREAWEALMDTDLIDEAMTEELEKLRETLNRKRPAEYLYSPEEAWLHFLEDRGEELEPFFTRLSGASETEPGESSVPTDDPQPSPLWVRAGGSGSGRPLRRVSSGKRTGRFLIAAVIVVLLAGAALAADSLGLWAWVPRWNAAAGRYEPAAQEVSGESPIPATLARLGITEPVYPAKLPEGFVITESHVNDDPLVLMEQYARGDKRFSITINPVEGFKTAVYQKSGEPLQEYCSGGAVHYIFAREGTITSLRYTDNYVTIVSGSIALEEIKSIIDSLRQVAS